MQFDMQQGKVSHRLRLRAFLYAAAADSPTWMHWEKYIGGILILILFLLFQYFKKNLFKKYL